MKKTKKQIVNKLMYRIEKICTEVFDSSLEKIKDNQLMTPLPATKAEITNILNKIVTALPPHFFLAHSKQVTEDIQQYVVNEYILFQAQEDITSKEFPDYLLNFIYDLINTINHAIEYEKTSSLMDL